MPQDKGKSLVWIQKAAELGDGGAQLLLGMSHQRAIRDQPPETAAQEKIQAYQWLRLAADQDYPGAESACILVNLQMTHEDVKEGRRRVEAFNENTHTV
jgi:TPR repeat protein